MKISFKSFMTLISFMTALALLVPIKYVQGEVLLSSSFDSGSDGFVYSDDAFATSQPKYASGSYVSSGGFSGGGVQVMVGGVDNATVIGMSGGWNRSFSLTSQSLVALSLRYRMIMKGTYEGDECSQALLTIDGVLLSPDNTGVLWQFCGSDPQTDIDLDSGWRQESVEMDLSAGTHTITVGGLNTKKTRANELTQLYFDDIEITQQGSSNEAICNDGLDNDGDGLTDCLDGDCDGMSGCEFNQELTCNDGLDNDGYGLTDCADSDCTGISGCEYGTEVTCNDGLDNDGDGLADCGDLDCDGVSGCEYGTEATCSDGVDNDGDGFADCMDSDCSGIPGCPEVVCNDGLDNDGDGLTDCLDGDCDGVSGCEFNQELTCNDGVDNDGDRLTDCADSDCAGAPNCGPEVICNDGLDNDGDGLTDCADPDCTGDPVCGSGGWGVLVSAGFDSGSDGFTYSDDVFGTSQPKYASGSYMSSGGFSGGGLQVVVGGVDKATVIGMSGGWSRSFSLTSQSLVALSLRYRMIMKGTYEGDECSQALLAIDGVLLSPDNTGVLWQFCGSDPQTDIDLDSGWRQESVEMDLSAGTHTITVGELNTKKTRANELTQLYFDDIEIMGSCVAPSVRILYPQPLYLQSSADLSVSASACLDGSLHVGWGVRFSRDGGVETMDDFEAPFEGIFLGLPPGEHTIEAMIIDSSGNYVPGPSTLDQVRTVGVGDYYVGLGDSITFGKDDDINSDDISLDGRNTGGGYEPILNNLLTTAAGYPNTIVNEGYSGYESADILQIFPSVMGNHPNAIYYLVILGTNDSYGLFPVPSGCGLHQGDPGYVGSYKDNMQQIISALKAISILPILGKVPITFGPCSTCEPFIDPTTAPRNALIRGYNTVISGGICEDNGLGEEGLLLHNGIPIAPPDFYGYFEQHPEEFSDNLHPNGIGYQSMAGLWLNALVP